MAERSVIQDMPAALRARAYPTITLWNRLETRPRTPEFDRALAAEVRDPLWMICRQWQLGEYRADDAGSPVTAKLQISTRRLHTYQPADHAVQAFSDDHPMEAQVECRPLPFRVGGQAVSLDLRLLMGRQWQRMLMAAVGDFSAEYRRAYPIPAIDPLLESSAPVAAHLEARQQWSAVAGRMMDGYALYYYMVSDASHHAWDGVAVPSQRRAGVDAVAKRFTHWFENLLYQPASEAEQAWTPPALEYRFACAAPGVGAERVYVADEYYHGRLDWYNLDQDADRRSLDGSGTPAAAADPPIVMAFVPGQVAFDGMPNARWWAFEDRKVNLGNVSPNTTDLGALLFLEFGLVYSNDWFVVPQAIAAGSLATVEGLAVSNVFGERTWIEPSGRGPQEDWQRWTMFEVSRRGHETERAERGLVLLPTAATIHDSQVLEEVSLLRDEMANMVWGVENRVLLPAGGTRRGAEAARETRLFLQQALERAQGGGSVGERLVDYQAPIRYQVMNTIPEHWIPFIPVHVDGDNRRIQLQRAALPRLLDGDPRTPIKIEPRTVLLRDGLDRRPKATYYLHEEEVPRAGARIFQAYRRARWYGGGVVTWLGVGKQTGRGEGSSGLAFDSLVPVTTQSTEV